MARVEVHGGRIADSTITELTVRLQGLPERTIDRDTALSWMRDGHSFLPIVGGQEQPALQLVEVEPDAFHIRTDNAAEAADSLPEGW